MPSSLKPGDRAPDFSLPDAGGKTVSLGDFRGKTVVLYFYPRDNTPGCTREACDFRDSLAAIRRKGAVVLGVSADSVESHGRFSSKFGLGFPLLSDEEKKAVRAYGVWRKKSFMGRQFMGIVRTTFIIDTRGLIDAVFPEVRVKGHVDEVLNALRG